MKPLKVFVPAAAIACLFALGATQASAADLVGNLVVNGGFESGDFTGWDSNWGIGVGTEVSTIVPRSGDYFAYTACAGDGCTSLTNGAFLEQNLATVAGQSYTLNFFVSTDAGGPSEIAAYWQGAQVFDLKNVPVTSPGYTEYTVSNLLATSSSTALQFSGRQDPAFLAIDDVSVVGPIAAVPEPASYALMLAGLGAVGALARRAKRS